jgi:hypothetical protein
MPNKQCPHSIYPYRCQEEQPYCESCQVYIGSRDNLKATLEERIKQGVQAGEDELNRYSPSWQHTRTQPRSKF